MLRLHLKLKKEALRRKLKAPVSYTHLAGVGTRIEVWGKDKWDTECDPDKLDDSIVESMGLFGI